MTESFEQRCRAGCIPVKSAGIAIDTAAIDVYKRQAVGRRRIGERILFLFLCVLSFRFRTIYFLCGLCVLIRLAGGFVPQHLRLSRQTHPATGRCRTTFVENDPVAEMCIRDSFLHAVAGFHAAGQQEQAEQEEG